jgi:hypothetical protein
MDNDEAGIRIQREMLKQALFREADGIFLEAMGVLGVKNWRKYPMFLAVRCFGFLAW